MPMDLEEALGLPPSKPVKKPVEKAALAGTAESGDTTVRPYVKMGLELFHRRKQLLVTYYSGLLNPAALKELASQFECSESALYSDWERRAKWEPFIWESYEAHEDGKVLLKQLQLARETALVLMKNPRVGGNARVGAVARFTEAIKTEIELKQSLGLLPRVTQAPQVQVNVDVQQNTEIEQTANLLAEYEHFFKEPAEAANLSANNSAEQVDKAKANSEANRIPVT